MSALSEMTKILRDSKITPESKKVEIKPVPENPIMDFLNGFKGLKHDNKK